MKAWLDEVTGIISQHIAHEWSWNGRDWFDTRGNVVECAIRWGEFRDVVEREAKVHYEQLGAWNEGFLS